MLLEGPGVLRCQQPQRVQRCLIPDLVGYAFVAHGPPKTSRNFTIPKRIRVFTVPRGWPSRSASSGMGQAAEKRQFDRLSLLRRKGGQRALYLPSLLGQKAGLLGARCQGGHLRRLLERFLQPPPRRRRPQAVDCPASRQGHQPGRHTASPRIEAPRRLPHLRVDIQGHLLRRRRRFPESAPPARRPAGGSRRTTRPAPRSRPAESARGTVAGPLPGPRGRGPALPSIRRFRPRPGFDLHRHGCHRSTYGSRRRFGFIHVVPLPIPGPGPGPAG